MSLTALVLLLRQPQKGLSVSMANTLGDHLLERVGGAAGAEAAARLTELERENVALQLGLAALVKLLEERGQIARGDVEKIAEIVQRVATAKVRPAGAPAAGMGRTAPGAAGAAAAPAAAVESEAAAIAAVAAAPAQSAAAAQVAPAAGEEAAEVELEATVEPVVEVSQDLAALAQALERRGERAG